MYEGKYVNVRALVPEHTDPKDMPSIIILTEGEYDSYILCDMPGKNINYTIYTKGKQPQIIRHAIASFDTAKKQYFKVDNNG